MEICFWIQLVSFKDAGYTSNNNIPDSLTFLLFHEMYILTQIFHMSFFDKAV